jgi:hypothetical protein
MSARTHVPMDNGLRTTTEDIWMKYDARSNLKAIAISKTSQFLLCVPHTRVDIYHLVPMKLDWERYSIVDLFHRDVVSNFKSIRRSGKRHLTPYFCRYSMRVQALSYESLSQCSESRCHVSCVMPSCLRQIPSESQCSQEATNEQEVVGFFGSSSETPTDRSRVSATLKYYTRKN